ncbi:mono/diheme cytochrome c family protein [Rhizobium wenxiniae]|uniref:Mono/diheme cytochrome c family protein n=1 Tax=Rhizobium wenxiniae TaxID=1737357 RepID=A0A7W9Y7Y4_9HYPH|nr:cytochrome c [Rhizobium wenxiniae]MBB6163665.1 mono/diheme cytochrome c family protein [Rhizobium wenxiniae]
MTEWSGGRIQSASGTPKFRRKSAAMARWRKYIIGICTIAVVGLLGAACFFFWPHALPEVQASKAQPTGAELIARGEYLTVAADCAACHTTKSGKAFAGGLAFKLPFGTIYSPNITPDKTVGIGDWSDAEFVRAMRSGVGKHGEDLYPAFPYTSYALLSTDDILAIRAYLTTLAPVTEAAPENALAFPFNQRPLMRGWKLLFVPRGPFEPDPARDKIWNDGAYLVEALAHCGECHTPRGLMFQRKQGVALSGGDVDGWKAWNITPDKEYGLGNWSDEQIAGMLSAGHAKGRGVAAGPMREAIDLSLSKLPTSDIDAIVAYLRTVPAVAGDPDIKAVRRKEEELSAASTPVSSDTQPGKQIYAGACASCHGWDGEGQFNPRAAIVGGHALSDPTASNVVRVVLQGSSDHGAAPGRTMPSFAKIYSDEDVAALANYVVEHFSGRTGTVTAKQISEAR